MFKKLFFILSLVSAIQVQSASTLKSFGKDIKNFAVNYFTKGSSSKKKAFLYFGAPLVGGWLLICKFIPEIVGYRKAKKDLTPPKNNNNDEAASPSKEKLEKITGSKDSLKNRNLILGLLCSSCPHSKANWEKYISKKASFWRVLRNNFFGKII